MSVIRGRVVAGDTGRPLRRALVTIASVERPLERRTISTSADGGYEMAELPAGRYTVSAGRSGYLTLGYGQTRPLEAGRPIQILDRQIVERLDFALPRMSIVAGRVTDETGEPLAGARVLLMRQAYVDGGRRLAVADYGSTDSVGQFRIVGVSPGAYIVMATEQRTWTTIENDVEQVVGFGPTYAPGTPVPQDAQRVTLGVGQTAENVVFSMRRARVATISGTAIDSSGRPLAGETVTLSQGFPNGGTNASFQLGGSVVGPDGAFELKNVPPGDYKLVMRYVVRAPEGTRVQEAGTLFVPVNGADIRNLRFASSRGGTIAGTVVADSGVLPDAVRRQIRIVSRPLVEDADLKVGGFDDSGEVNDDGSFYVGGVFGRSRIRASLPEGWMLKAVLRDGRETTDDPIEVGGERVSGVQVILTDRLAALTGSVADDVSGSATVIVFHRDAERWADAARYVSAVRPDQDGAFAVHGLPPGDYLAVAIGYVDQGRWNDPEYLESLRRFGQRVSLVKTGAQVVSLKMVNP